jgi:hypothetical protein
VVMRQARAPAGERGGVAVQRAAGKGRENTHDAENTDGQLLYAHDSWSQRKHQIMLGW